MAKIDLNQLGLTQESTFEEIQTKLNELELFNSSEVEEKSNASASAARKAAEAKFKKQNTENQLSEDELKEYANYKKTKKINSLKDNEKLKEFNDSDFNLLVKAYGLTDLEGDELDTEISKLYEAEKTRISNGLPAPIVDDANTNNAELGLPEGVK